MNPHNWKSIFSGIQLFLRGLNLTQLLDEPKEPVVVILSYCDSRNGLTQAETITLNRHHDSIAPFFPHDSGYFEGRSAIEAIQLDHDFVLVTCTVLADNAADAKTIALQVIGAVQNSIQN